MIGNAVPPAVVSALAAQVMKSLSAVSYIPVEPRLKVKCALPENR